MAYSDYLDQTAKIETPVKSQNDFGEEERTWEEKYSEVETRYRRASKERELSIEGSSYTVTIEDYVFWFTNEIEADKGDRIVIDGKAFEFIVPLISDSSKHHKKGFARQISF